MRVRCRMSIFLLLTSSCKVYSGSPYPPRYSDLQEVFGTDYCAATGHYITNGVDENRLGYNPSGGYGRYTVQNSASGIYISTSNRTAGAIDSLAWNNKEFINSYDHGRQFQVSWSSICDTSGAIHQTADLTVMFISCDLVALQICSKWSNFLRCIKRGQQSRQKLVSILRFSINSSTISWY